MTCIYGLCSQLCVSYHGQQYRYSTNLQALSPNHASGCSTNSSPSNQDACHLFMGQVSDYQGGMLHGKMWQALQYAFVMSSMYCPVLKYLFALGATQGHPRCAPTYYINLANRGNKHHFTVHMKYQLPK